MFPIVLLKLASFAHFSSSLSTVDKISTFSFLVTFSTKLFGINVLISTNFPFLKLLISNIITLSEVKYIVPLRSSVCPHTLMS